MACLVDFAAEGEDEFGHFGDRVEVELLDAVVEGVDDVDVVAGLFDGNRLGLREGAGAGTAVAAPTGCGFGAGLELFGAGAHTPAEGEDEFAVGAELVDALVFAVGDEEVAARLVDGEPFRSVAMAGGAGPPGRADGGRLGDRNGQKDVE